MKTVKLAVGDTIRMKMPHLCCSDVFLVLRVGSDIRIKCSGCGRDVTVPRIKIEKNIKMVNEEKIL